MGRAIMPRESSWLQLQADEQERLDGQAREGSPMFTWTHWPKSPCGRASAAGQASRPPSRSALKRVFIYPSRISSAGADGGNCSCPKGSWEQPWSLPGWGWVSSPFNPLCCARDSRSRRALGRWNRSYLSSRAVFVAWKSTSLSFKIIIRMQVYKNVMLLIFVVLFCYFLILMWIYTVTKACVHPHWGPGPKPLEGNGRCFHKLLWAPNQAQDKTRSLVKDKEVERKENRGSASQSVSVLVVNWFCGKPLRNGLFFLCAVSMA